MQPRAGRSIAPSIATRGRARSRGFTLIELMVVMALIAVAVGVVTLSLRDPAAAQLDREAVRLAALLESARWQSRSAGVPLRFELGSKPDDPPFRFVGTVGGGTSSPRFGLTGPAPLRDLHQGEVWSAVRSAQDRPGSGRSHATPR